MPNRQSYESASDWPAFLQRAHAVDRSYYERARCASAVEGVHRQAWTAEPKKSYENPLGGKRIPGPVLIEQARMGCRTCPVQWTCAETAIDAGEPVGTWGDSHKNIEWLAKQAEWREKLHMAESAGVTVQRLIDIMRGTPT